MATVVITIKIMPVSPDTDLGSLTTTITEKIKNFGGNVGKTETEPIAFGLKATILMFSMDESRGGTEELEKQITELEGVNSVQVIDVRRAIG